MGFPGYLLYEMRNPLGDNTPVWRLYIFHKLTAFLQLQYINDRDDKVVLNIHMVHTKRLFEALLKIRLIKGRTFDYTYKII